MMIKSIEQILFGKLHELIAQELEFDTYLHLPDEKTKYPFVVLGAIQEIPAVTKTTVKGTYRITIDVWGNSFQRYEASLMATQIMKSFKVIQADGLTFRQREQASDKMVIADTSTNKPLWHVILNLEYNLE